MATRARSGREVRVAKAALPTKDGGIGARERWLKEVYRPAKERAPERQKSFETSSGIEIPPALGPESFPPEHALERLAWPGEYPFTRGVQPTMYRGRFWTMRQYAGFGTAEETNGRFKQLLAAGQTGLSVAFDLPTQMGRDSDHARAQGEVGRVGVAIDCIDDMEALLAGLPLDRVSTSMTINATAATLLAFYAAVGARRGVALADLQGTVQNDILKEYMARGTYIYPPAASLRLTTDMFAFTAKEMPRFNPISISGYHIREAGSTAVQEVAFTLADGVAYVEAASRAGLPVDSFAQRLSFFFNVHNNFVEEVAKFRAARRLWARLMKERFGAKDPRSMMLRFHAQTAGSTLTAQQTDNNVVRVSLQALAAVLGGCQSLHTNSRDEALSLPTAEAATLALRTQQILAYESHVADFVDPFGGAYAVEQLTEEIETRAEDYLRRIDELGGMVEAIAQGFPQREIQDAAYRDQQAVERGESVVVGVNRFTEGPETDDPQGVGPERLRIDPRLEEQQVRRLAAFRKARDGAAAGRAVLALADAARGRANLVPLILEAVRARATLGEIADGLRDVFGEYREQVVL
jgi:methylmalonyl-CoA mutase N-terminal domain/subunit